MLRSYDTKYPIKSQLLQLKSDARPQQIPNSAYFLCATPQHEALEAFRWMRELIASGNARPEEIAIAAASPADFDDHMMALCADANIPIHFVHDVKAVTNRDGRTDRRCARRNADQRRLTRTRTTSVRTPA